MTQETGILRAKHEADVTLQAAETSLSLWENQFTPYEDTPAISPLFRDLLEQEGDTFPAPLRIFTLKESSDPYGCFRSFFHAKEWKHSDEAPFNLVVGAKYILQFFAFNRNLLAEQNWFLVNKNLSNPNPSEGDLQLICIWRKKDGTFTIYDKPFRRWGMLGGYIFEESQILVPTEKIVPTKRKAPTFEKVMEFNTSMLPIISNRFHFGYFTEEEFTNFLNGTISTAQIPEVLTHRAFDDVMAFNRLLPNASNLFAAGRFTLQDLKTFLRI